MYELLLSKLFRNQLKKLATKSQPAFMLTCQSWDRVHKEINEFGKKGNPFQTIRFLEKVDRKNFYLVYRLVEDKKQLWVETMAKKQTKHRFSVYNP